MSNYKNSKVVEIATKKYCAYCGKNALNQSEPWDDRDWIEHHYCDCKLALDEVNMNKEIADALTQIERKYGGKSRFKENKKATDKVRFDIELENLKRKYYI